MSVWKIGFGVLLALSLSGCDGKQTMGWLGGKSQSECEEEKAKAILWVDRKGEESLKDYGLVRTVKVRANVYSDGTFRLISFCKKQDDQVVKYLKKRVEAFTIPAFFFEENYLQPGEQYLQLRYIPEKIK